MFTYESKSGKLCGVQCQLSYVSGIEDLYFSRCEVLWWARVCLSVCLSVREHISRATRAIFANFLCVLPVAVARSSSGRWQNPKTKGAILRLFLFSENALCSIAFGTHTKTAKPIDMPFWIKTYVGSQKRPPFYFSNYCQKLTDFNDYFVCVCVESWENLTSLACTFAHLAYIL